MRDYQLWYAQQMAHLYTHAPRFWGLDTYEHSMSRPAGGRKVLGLKRDGPLLPINRAKGLDAPDSQSPVMWRWMRDSP